MRAGRSFAALLVLTVTSQAARLAVVKHWGAVVTEGGEARIACKAHFAKFKQLKENGKNLLCFQQCVVLKANIAMTSCVWRGGRGREEYSERDRQVELGSSGGGRDNMCFLTLTRVTRDQATQHTTRVATK